MKSQCERKTEELAMLKGTSFSHHQTFFFLRAQIKLKKENLRIQASKARRKSKEQAKKDQVEKKGFKKKTKTDLKYDNGIFLFGSSMPIFSHPLFENLN